MIGTSEAAGERPHPDGDRRTERVMIPGKLRETGRSRNCQSFSMCILSVRGSVPLAACTERAEKIWEGGREAHEYLSVLPFLFIHSHGHSTGSA